MEPKPYHEAFPAGTTVRIAGRASLETFMETWKYHHNLQQPTRVRRSNREGESCRRIPWRRHGVHVGEYSGCLARMVFAKMELAHEKSF
jgi:hypothetical protein